MLTLFEELLNGFLKESSCDSERKARRWPPPCLCDDIPGGAAPFGLLQIAPRPEVGVGVGLGMEKGRGRVMRRGGKIVWKVRGQEDDSESFPISLNSYP